MEEQEVLRLFGLFTGLSEEEAAGWAVLCRSTIAELTGRLRPGVDPASDANRERLSAAAAAALQQEYLAAVRELVDTGAFCFERVRSHGV